MVDVAVLGGTGYVAAEAVRLLSAHPGFRLRWVVSSSSAGARVADTFPHLAGLVGVSEFVPEEALVSEAAGPVAVLSALPHGASAPALRRLVGALPKGTRAFDLSADLRSPGSSLGDGAPVTCGLPDIERGVPEGHVSEPGCFATALTLACAPLVAHGLTVGPLVLNGVTGSTGSGNTPKAGTHHPTRNGGMWAYEPARHRHVDEVEAMLSHLGGRPEVWFVPHSGPFSRGIHATLQATLARGLGTDDAVDLFRSFYAHSPFVLAGPRMPNLREVQGSNRCHLGVLCHEGRVVVTSVIDNLVKGAAGGGVQWMNRVYGLAEDEGLAQPGLMWA